MRGCLSRCKEGDDRLDWRRRFSFSSSCTSLAAALALLITGMGGCSGKKRDFASGGVSSGADTMTPVEHDGGSVESLGVADGESAREQGPGSERGAIPGSFMDPGDAGSSQSSSGSMGVGAGALSGAPPLASVGEACDLGARACSPAIELLDCVSGAFAFVESCTIGCGLVGGLATCVEACTSGTLCAGAEAACAGCLIDEECIAADSPNPDNPCQVCDRALNSNGWSSSGVASCDDGLFCTVDDACVAGACVGVPRECDDEVGCNGVSTCEEAGGRCSADVNQCGSDAVCDTDTGACVSTCAGCLIDGVCRPAGGDAAGNPCLVCDPARSRTNFSVANGRACGAGASDCSQQDTCDASGRCAPNHLPAGTACGSSDTSACDRADTCDGNGACQARGVANGTACDDGSFCTEGDQCQGQRCAPLRNRVCGANQACNEALNQCQCQGCQVGGSCVSAGAQNPTNPCQVCDPGRSTTSYSSNAGELCGAGPSACSGQDTCNAQGQCAPNDFPVGMSCATGVCQGNGECRALADGTPCTGDTQCAARVCTTFFRDLDGDGFGSSSDTTRVCGTVLPNGFVARGGDCCDVGAPNREVAARIRPGQIEYFADAQTVCPGVGSYDYDCRDGATSFLRTPTDAGALSTICDDIALDQCDGTSVWDSESTPSCGASAFTIRCAFFEGAGCFGLAPAPPNVRTPTVNRCH